MENKKEVIVIGGGLAGVEAAIAAKRLGADVTLYEMKPIRFSPAHNSELLAELVCSNSFKAKGLGNAKGILKEEMRLLNSVVMEAALASRVPAGGALAVDRDVFSRHVTEAVVKAGVKVVRAEITELPEGKTVVVASGPLTSTAFSEALSRKLGSENLYFYDAIAPVVYKDSVDFDVAFMGSRYGKGGDDYINCPMSEDEYDVFVRELRAAEKTELREFEKITQNEDIGLVEDSSVEGKDIIERTAKESCQSGALRKLLKDDEESVEDLIERTAKESCQSGTQKIFFEGCIPIEEMAERGDQTLSFGPLKPVGFIDPRSGERPFAIVQLRRENREDTIYNMVGFQTRLKHGEQKRVFSLIPGLRLARFARLGSIHRNSFINSPRLLFPSLELKSCEGVFFAGQITGVEGYSESAASGIVAGINAARFAQGEALLTLPRSTMLGALLGHITDSRVEKDVFQPMNSNFGILQGELPKGPKPAPGARRKRISKHERREIQGRQAAAELLIWVKENVSELADLSEV
jgi:methylenetetrahydrofolate--tRNA-(uracil-5-)-methyltransferase